MAYPSHSAISTSVLAMRFPLHQLVDQLDRAVHTVSFTAQQERRDIGINCRLDALRAFGAVAQTADGRALTDPFRPIRVFDPNQDSGLRAHRRHRKHVSSNCRDVEDHRLDLVDLRHGLHRICKFSSAAQNARPIRILSMMGGVLGDTLRFCAARRA